MNASQRRRERRIQQQALERQSLLQRSGGKPKAEVLAKPYMLFDDTAKHEIKIDFKMPDFSQAMLKSMVHQFNAVSPRWISGSSILWGNVAPSVNTEQLESLKSATPYKVQPRHETPDYVEVITGWRAWAVVYDDDGLRLKALGAKHVWKPKEQVNAICTNSGQHPAPQMACTCGVWAFKELDSLVAAIGSYGTIRVLGQVSLWGRVVETTNGYRAQHAYPSELWLLDDSLEELGYIYDVPVRMVKPST